MPGRALVAGAVLLWLSRHPGATPAAVSQVFNIGIPFAEDVMRPDLFEPCDLGEALQVWSLLFGADASLVLASSVFSMPLSSIMKAVEEHYYLYTERRDGMLCIGHDGD